ncbi:hypothetical protein SAMN04489761_0389 [Tenacibaculum sp. MAR_2009_124]|nr:hypothetical protein SAMN04489761_0389 [Tenacibaculum sp. MAR_2009_124]
MCGGVPFLYANPTIIKKINSIVEIALPIILKMDICDVISFFLIQM